MLRLLFAGIFYGQYLQDEFVDQNFFHGKTNGIYVDIGANDGISLSNTYYFEKEKGWNGLCIEPIPAVFEELKKNRKALCIQGCIAEKAGSAQFTHVTGYAEMLSGLSEKYPPRHQVRIENDLKEKGGGTEVFEVKCFRLNDLLVQNNFFHVDYLSLDTEGGELEILKSIDYDTFDIDVIDVENNYQDSDFQEFLNSKGYVLIKRIGVDEIYKKRKYEPILHQPTLDFIRQYLPENPVIVEARAHKGENTANIRKTWKKATIYAFETNSEEYSKLMKRCKKMKNVKLFQIALGEDSSSSEAPHPSSLLKNLISLKRPIQTTTLDSWAKKNTLSKIDFLCLDLQGSEFQMLKASPNILKTIQVIQTVVSRKIVDDEATVFDESAVWLEKQGFLPICLPNEPGYALFVRKPLASKGFKAM